MVKRKIKRKKLFQMCC